MRTIYFLRNSDGDVLYIGCTFYLRNRLSNIRYHKDWWTEVTDVRFYEVDDDRAADEELAAIEHFRPRYNKHGVTIGYRRPVPLHGRRAPRTHIGLKPGPRTVRGLSPAELLAERAS
jgi:excinuclease UvrABC nuclease subunit